MERDRIILAFVVAVNERNNASSDLDVASNDDERAKALTMIESARFHSQRLQAAVLDHCRQHGC